MAKGKAAGKGRDVLVVASKVRAYIKSKKCNTSGDAVEALSNCVYCAIDEAVQRASKNGRKTVRAHDV